MFGNLKQILQFNAKHSKSHSALVDLQQLHVRNIILFCFSLSITRQLFGENIICHTNKAGIAQSYVDTNCFMNGTFNPNDEGPIYHDYYQWVSVYILLLAFSFHFPFACWSRLYRSYLNEISTPVKTIEQGIQLLETIEISQGNFLFWKTWALEVFYTVHLFCHIWLCNVFFNNEWSQMGWSWKAIPKLFPQTGSCYVTYITFDVTVGKFLCLLPLNIIYRKVFWILYGIVIVLIILSLLTFIYRIRMVVQMGRKYVNVWWATKIARDSSETWIVEKYLDDCLKGKITKDLPYNSEELKMLEKESHLKV